MNKGQIMHILKTTPSSQSWASHTEIVEKSSV